MPNVEAPYTSDASSGACGKRFPAVSKNIRTEASACQVHGSKASQVRRLSCRTPLVIATRGFNSRASAPRGERMLPSGAPGSAVSQYPDPPAGGFLTTLRREALELFPGNLVRTWSSKKDRGQATLSQNEEPLSCSFSPHLLARSTAIGKTSTGSVSLRQGEVHCPQPTLPQPPPARLYDGRT